MPIGMPGWPEFAFCTASIASARIALAICATPLSESAPGARESFMGNQSGCGKAGTDPRVAWGGRGKTRILAKGARPAGAVESSVTAFTLLLRRARPRG